jgi:hypothetical protein
MDKTLIYELNKGVGGSSEGIGGSWRISAGRQILKIESFFFHFIYKNVKNSKKFKK